MALLILSKLEGWIIENIEIVVFFTVSQIFWVRHTPQYKITSGTGILKDKLMCERVLKYWKNVQKDKFGPIFLCFAIFAQWAKKRNFLEFSEP